MRVGDTVRATRDITAWNTEAPEGSIGTVVEVSREFGKITSAEVRFWCWLDELICVYPNEVEIIKPCE